MLVTLLLRVRAEVKYFGVSGPASAFGTWSVKAASKRQTYSLYKIKSKGLRRQNEHELSFTLSLLVWNILTLSQEPPLPSHTPQFRHPSNACGKSPNGRWNQDSKNSDDRWCQELVFSHAFYVWRGWAMHCCLLHLRFVEATAGNLRQSTPKLSTSLVMIKVYQGSSTPTTVLSQRHTAWNVLEKFAPPGKPLCCSPSLQRKVGHCDCIGTHRWLCDPCRWGLHGNTLGGWAWVRPPNLISKITNELRFIKL